MGKEDKPWGLPETAFERFKREVEEEADADPTGEARRELDQLRTYYSVKAAREIVGGPRTLDMDVSEVDGKISITVNPNTSGRLN